MGHPTPPGAAFCPDCGWQLHQAGPPPGPQSDRDESLVVALLPDSSAPVSPPGSPPAWRHTPHPPGQPSPDRFKRWPVVIFTAIVGVLVVITVGILVVVNQGDDRSSSSGATSVPPDDEDPDPSAQGENEIDNTSGVFDLRQGGEIAITSCLKDALDRPRAEVSMTAPAEGGASFDFRVRFESLDGITDYGEAGTSGGSLNGAVASQDLSAGESTVIAVNGDVAAPTAIRCTLDASSSEF